LHRLRLGHKLTQVISHDADRSPDCNTVFAQYSRIKVTHFRRGGFVLEMMVDSVFSAVPTPSA
jgi:alkyl hydroperoxide reductase subunit AhpC